MREENFEYREWLALSFAREWIFSNGNITGWEKYSEYEARWSADERRYILKLVKMMDFFNQAGNMFIRIPWKYSIERGDSCSLSFTDKID
ncbi:MAG TPA: hypothetical protein P5120_11950 [Spirochaetota bacterium]|nr:hypothetical protein [Spirochaetota bacterium]HPR38611.1 hypothetical protein [Spirochaetota bacterium]HRX48223.1 hypothetical protein [Spirochaetota bacterium]